MNTQLETLERLIESYKLETDMRKKHVEYLSLVEESLKLVKKIVSRMYPLPSTVTAEDLIQVGALGVLKAIETYELSGKGSYKTYVTKVIRGQILHYLRDKANIVRPPRESIENLNKVKDAIDLYTEKNNVPPTPEIISQMINLPIAKVEEVLEVEQLKNMISLDQNVYTTDGSETLLDRIQDTQNDAFEDFYENKKIIEDAIAKLPEPDKDIITMYYIEGFSQKNIASKHNMTATQISRTIKRSLNKLYYIIQSEMTEI